MTRGFTASLALLGVFALVGVDLMISPPNPYRAPLVFALGSGQASAGGFCGALPQ